MSTINQVTEAVRVLTLAKIEAKLYKNGLLLDIVIELCKQADARESYDALMKVTAFTFWDDSFLMINGNKSIEAFEKEQRYASSR